MALSSILNSNARVRFVIAEPRDLPEDRIYSKERKLIEEIKKELLEGRRCQVFAVYMERKIKKLHPCRAAYI